MSVLFMEGFKHVSEHEFRRRWKGAKVRKSEWFFKIPERYLMKKRRIIFTIEVESDEKIKDLKDSVTSCLNYEDNTVVKQVQANVVQKKK